MKTYVKGSLINLRGQFRNPALPADDAEGLLILAATGEDPGQLFDPVGARRFKIFPPNGPLLTETYLTDAAVVRDDVGKYRRQYQPLLEGDFAYRFESDGQIAAGEMWFRVQDTPF
jgi:hypothetical protein